MSPLEPIIRDARARGEYRCARCDYPLHDVPLLDDLSIKCPECGYEMVFRVKVQLMPRDPEYDREVRSILGRLERLILPVSLTVVLAAVGLAFVVYAITS